ncbi:MAG: hypothetical protein ABJ311_10725 [Erythrobacter sp.]
MQTPPSDSSDQGALTAPDGWQELREDGDIQFEPIEFPEPEPREPSWFEEALQKFFEWLGDLLSPVGGALGMSWSVFQWVLLGLLVLFVLFLIWRLIGPMGLSPKAASGDEETPEWAPDRAESMALLEDADRLAAHGKFDEATHLLLKRSVSQIASARPDWVEPSSTARELAALPALSEAARGAFRVIAERVERSLFALRSLDRSDWEAARSAYADFALQQIGRGTLQA